MRNQVNNSQSTAAVNSANVSFKLSAYFSSEFGYRRMYVTDKTFNEFRYNYDGLFGFIKRAIEDSKINTHFIFETSVGRFCFAFSKDDNGYIVVGEEWSGSDFEYQTLVKRFTNNNINKITEVIFDIIADYFYGVYEADDENTEAEIYEAPSLDEAPCLEQDDITEDGYSVAGLVYVRENMDGVDVVSMLKESMGDLFNDPYTMENIMRGGVLDQEKFADALWDIVWEEHLCGLTDEALEAETRYYTDFDALCLQLCGAVAAYDEVMRVVKEKSDSTCGAQGFAWDLFSEETMLTLFDNANLLKQIGDALFESVGCSDILPYDDCLYLWYNNDSWKTNIVAA